MDQVVQHLRFSGRVQGVGFRFTARRHAQRQGLTGYVRNLSDGSVDLVCAGPAAAVERFLVALRESMRGNIESEQVLPAPADETYQGFEIRR